MSLSRKFITQEDVLATALKNQNSKETQKFRNDFLSFWECYDAIYGTNHIKIISELYLKRKHTLEEIAFNCYVDDKTLYRYRRKYMESARFFMTKTSIDF